MGLENKGLRNEYLVLLKAFQGHNSGRLSEC